MRTKTARQLKILAILSSLVLALRATIAGALPYRATADEALVFRDILVAMSSEPLTDPYYYSGIGYQLSVGVITTVFDFSVMDLDYYSPIFGSIAFASISVCLFCILRRVCPRDLPSWAVAIPPLSLVVFAGFLNRLAETTHKAFTFTLLFAALLAAILSLPDGSKRAVIIGVVLSVGIAAMNYAWGLLFGSIVVLTITLGRQSPFSRPIEYSIPAASFVAAYHLPGVHIHYDYFARTVPALIAGLTGTGGAGSTAADAGAATGAWPTVSLFGVEFTTWLIYSAGIGVVCVITVLSGVLFLLDWWSQRTINPIHALYLSTAAVLSPVLLALLVSGDLATLKRLLPILGAFASLYLIGRLWVLDEIGIDDRMQRLALAGIFVALVVTAPLAIPRMTLDDERAPVPYDNYADQRQVDHVEWIAENDASQCHVAESVENYVSRKLVDTSLSADPLKRPAKVYHGGPRTASYCAPS